MIYQHKVRGEYEGKDLHLEEGLSSLVFYESVYGGNTFSLRTTSADWDTWDYVIRNEAGIGMLHWGITSDVGEEWADERVVVFPAGKIRYRREYAEVLISGVDASWLMNEKVSKSLAFNNVRISSIVESISDLNGMKSDVETTDGLYTLYRCNLTDLKFLYEVLLPRAVSVGGRTDYLLYVVDGTTIVFKPPDYDRVDYTFLISPREQQIKEANYSSADLEFRRLFLPELKSWNVRFIGWDVMKKEVVDFNVNDYTVNLPTLAPRKPPIEMFGFGPSLTVPITDPGTGDSKRSDFENRGKSIWCRHYRGRYRIKLVCSPLVKAKPGQVVNLDIVDADGNSHYSGGKYFVYAVKHRIYKTRYNTILYLERRNSR